MDPEPGRGCLEPLHDAFKWRLLFWGPKLRGICPTFNIRCPLGLLGFRQSRSLLRAKGHQCRPLAHKPRKYAEALFQGLRVFETPPSLGHGAPFQNQKRKVGAQPAFLSTINISSRAMIPNNVARREKFCFRPGKDTGLLFQSRRLGQFCSEN
jgi:hypothetical protein